ncbi:MAG: MBL fold metallo-hydrolase [Nitrososphaerota archaeon]|nr:MBL fold metallo-hydrolase [Nitrososphaerota archaeon]
MATLTFYGGVDEIGGNKILLEDRGTRVLLDFGKSFSARSDYYDWTEKPRLANGIGDFLALGILPELQGIYREDLLKLARVPSKEDRFVDALILSHAHSDHADYISFLREDVPIHMGETTRDIINALEEERSANIEFEISKFKKRPLDRSEAPVKRELHTFKTGDKIHIDSIEVDPIHVDHSLPGCYGFIIRTSTDTIAYSGDLRIHGNHADLTKDFIERAKIAKSDLMLCEGTRINESNFQRENDVYESSLGYILQARNNFVFVEYSYKDIDRFMTFYRVARETGRKIVIDPKTARYLHVLSRNPRIKVPEISDDTIVVYRQRVKSGSYSESDYDEADSNVFKTASVWSSDEVKKNESRVIMTLGSRHIEELIDIRPKNGIYLHSSSEPFNEEGEIDEERTKNWIQRFGLVRLHAHCSGHASGRDLNYIVNEISPKCVIPIHTEHPELFLAFHAGKVKLAKPQVTMSV